MPQDYPLVGNHYGVYVDLRVVDLLLDVELNLLVGTKDVLQVNGDGLHGSQLRGTVCRTVTPGLRSPEALMGVVSNTMAAMSEVFMPIQKKKPAHGILYTVFERNRGAERFT